LLDREKKAKAGARNVFELLKIDHARGCYRTEELRRRLYVNAIQDPCEIDRSLPVLVNVEHLDLR
jgi:hypothetical protein